MAEVRSKLRRVAFFGGSFDPPHDGHLAIARAARDALKLDEVLFAPVGVQPLKILDTVGGAGFEDRLEMTRLAIEGEAGFKLSMLDEPVSDGVPNFTANTLERLRAEADPFSKKAGEIFCLIGADSFLQLHRWHRASELPFLAELIVAARPGEELEPMAQHLPPGIELVDGPLLNLDGSLQQWRVKDAKGRGAMINVLPNLHYEISATELRAAIHNGEEKLLSGKKLLPRAVVDYINTHQLYR